MNEKEMRWNGGFVSRAKRAPVASKKGCALTSGAVIFFGERSEPLLLWRRAAGLARARRFSLGERSEPLLLWAARTHGPGDARSRSEVQNLMLRWSRTTYKSDFGFFFLTKRRQKKTREQFNSEYEKKRLPRRGWVLLKWPILAIFVKKWPFKPAIS